MTVTLDSMALAVLKYKGKPTTTNNIRSLVIWAVSESTNAKWNPWATTYRGERGETQFNSAGVQNYPSIEEGIAAFWATLENGDYDTIIACLNQGEVPALTCEAIMASPWGSHPDSGIQGTVLSNWNNYATRIVAGSEDTVDTAPEPDHVPDDIPLTSTATTDAALAAETPAVTEIDKVVSAIGAEETALVNEPVTTPAATKTELIANMRTHVSELDSLVTHLEAL